VPNDCMLCLQQAAPELARNISVTLLSDATPLHSSFFFCTHTPLLSSVFGLVGCAATRSLPRYCFLKTIEQQARSNAAEHKKKTEHRDAQPIVASLRRESPLLFFTMGQARWKWWPNMMVASGQKWLGQRQAARSILFSRSMCAYYVQQSLLWFTAINSKLTEISSPL
jgi:hypothetical protein